MLDIRTLRDDDLPDLRQLDDWAFGHAMSDDRWAVASAVLERDRQVGAFDGAALVGHTAAFTHELTVPGGSVASAGVTWVGVAPTHRRRGVFAALMRHQLAALSGSGEPVAALWASEPGIYGRFGYGVASRKAVVTVPRLSRSTPSPAGLCVVLGDVDDGLADCVDVYERVRPQRPGMISRSAQAWRETSLDEPTHRGGASPLRCARVRDESGQAQGYAWFRTRPDWSSGSPEGTVEVTEMLTTTAAAARALADVVLDLDLMARASMWNLALDDPLLMWQYGRRLRPAIDEQLWVRLVRLDEALQARTYAVEIDVVLEVSDDVFPHNAGRWRLAGDDTGATVSRTSSPADVSLDVSDLAGGYLGDDHLNRAVAAGLTPEKSAGAALRLARAMRGDRAPWCAYMF
ncbi:MAG: GNAT family N-acetyltransferase [Jiangellales bacterium]